MSRKQLIGYNQALEMTLDAISPAKNACSADLAECQGHVLFDDIYSRVDSPSIDASMKDGYAVRSEDISMATSRHHIYLDIIGTAAAGLPAARRVIRGTAIRILTGAKIPDGSNAVLAEEFTTRENDRLTVFNTAEPGRNILPKGEDVGTGELIAEKGSRITPGMVGILAAAGIDKVTVFRQPDVAILATGDELVIPGQPLPEGKLYASNMEMLKAWCMKYGISTTFILLSDKPDLITRNINTLISTHDVVMTSGGAWTGDRDYVADALDALGWKKIFHSIRIGPGKPVGFGTLNNKPVFLLPGGPPSNLTAFLQIALPGILRLGGDRHPALPRVMVTLTEDVDSRHIDWTQFVYGRFTIRDTQVVFTPLRLTSRLKSIAGAQGIIAVPEGKKSLSAGDMVTAQVLD